MKRTLKQHKSGAAWEWHTRRIVVDVQDSLRLTLRAKMARFSSMLAGENAPQINLGASEQRTLLGEFLWIKS